jgi:uncharacterized protein YkwD
VSILKGNGKGGFRAAVNYAAGKSPFALAVADVNGDKLPDIAVANSTTNTVSLLFAKAGGVFSAPTPITVGNLARSVAIADFNRDGKNDLVAASFNGMVKILFNNGRGRFPTHTNISLGSGPYAVIAKDLNKDKKTDLAVALYNGNKIAIILGNGGKTFKTPTAVASGVNPWALSSADINSDGNNDLLVTNFTGSTLSILYGKGNGLFKPRTSFSVGSGPSSIVLADVDRNKKIDVAVANHYDSTISLLFGENAVTTPPASNPPTTTPPPVNNPPSTTTPPPSNTVAALEQRAITLINQYRSSQGLAPLTANSTLSAVARSHSQEMANGAAFDHTNWEVRMQQAGNSLNIAYRGGGEIIASSWGYSAPADQAVSDWINSTPHRNIMLGVGRNTSLIGIGVAVSRSGETFFTGMTY